MVSSKEYVSPQDGWQWQSDESPKCLQYYGKSITYVGIKWSNKINPLHYYVIR